MIAAITTCLVDTRGVARGVGTGSPGPETLELIWTSANSVEQGGLAVVEGFTARLDIVAVDRSVKARS